MIKPPTRFTKGVVASGFRHGLAFHQGLGGQGRPVCLTRLMFPAPWTERSIWIERAQLEISEASKYFAIQGSVCFLAIGKNRFVSWFHMVPQGPSALLLGELFLVLLLQASHSSRLLWPPVWHTVAAKTRNW